MLALCCQKGMLVHNRDTWELCGAHHLGQSSLCAAPDLAPATDPQLFHFLSLQLPKLLELVGLGYTAWFTYRYLLFKVRSPSQLWGCWALLVLCFGPQAF